MKTAVFVCCVWLTVTPQLGEAQAVYRCGPDGRSYSHQPCAEGRTVRVEDARTPEQRSAAAAATGREGLAADALERQRLEAEARGARRGPGALSAARKPAAADKASRSKKTGTSAQARKKRRAAAT